jgi:hypothetical protein
MRKMLSSAMALAVLGVAAPAMAGGSQGSIGVGGQFSLAGIGGGSVVYDGGQFHAGGIAGFYDPDPTEGADASGLDIGGEFWFHLHSTAMSDFGVGGRLLMQFTDFDDDAIEDETLAEIDIGAQFRAFIVSNVALSATIGAAIFTADGDGFYLTGDIVGVGGLHYYFF